jgi:hypothetical protein
MEVSIDKKSIELQKNIDDITKDVSREILRGLIRTMKILKENDPERDEGECLKEAHVLILGGLQKAMERAFEDVVDELDDLL